MIRSTIIVPAMNNSNLTIDCIRSVVKFTPMETPIIIFDDYSNDWHLNNLIKNLPQNTGYRKIDIMRSSSNCGFAKACNEAAQMVSRSTSVIIFLNNDAVITDKWLQPLVSNIVGDTAIVGSKLLYPEDKFSHIHQRKIQKGTIQHAGISVNEDCLPFHAYQFEKNDLPEANIKKTVPYVTGASLAISRELFDVLGGFNPKYTNGCEDLDLCVRVRNSGKSVLYCPESVAFHHETATRNPETGKQNLTLFQEQYRDQLEKDKSFISKESL